MPFNLIVIYFEINARNSVKKKLFTNAFFCPPYIVMHYRYSRKFRNERMDFTEYVTMI